LSRRWVVSSWVSIRMGLLSGAEVGGIRRAPVRRMVGIFSTGGV
jgi:hypothetical protein